MNLIKKFNIIPSFAIFNDFIIFSQIKIYWKTNIFNIFFNNILSDQSGSLTWIMSIIIPRLWS